MKTAIIPSFLSEQQFNDPKHTFIDDLGPIVTIFIPSLEIGGMWLPTERRWILQYPLTMDQHIAAARRYLAATDQTGAAMRYCQAAGTLPPPPQAIN